MIDTPEELVARAREKARNDDEVAGYDLESSAIMYRLADALEALTAELGEARAEVERLRGKCSCVDATNPDCLLHGGVL